MTESIPGSFRSCPPATTTLEILRTGPLALVQDLGRPGLVHIGVTRSGAADRRSHTLANRLVANPGDEATIEVMLGGLTARVRRGDIAIAVTGADTDPAVNGIPFGTNSIHHVHDAQVISLGAPHSGLRTYLAVRGGIAVTPVLGSRSYDVMSAIGPAPLQPGDVLPVGEHTADFPELDQAPVAAFTDELIELAVVPARATTGWPIRTRWCTPTGWHPIAATVSACGWSVSRCGRAGRIGSCPARAPPAARSRCRRTECR
jgi:biotin-dependent carboxylase-like uncharacterized protein